MTYIIIASSEGGRITAESRAVNEATAITKTNASIEEGYTDAFYAPVPSEGATQDWLVDPIAKTISYDPLPERKNPVISFDDFEARFTPSEWNEATDFVYEVDTTTGKPERRALIQGLARAQARNFVDLADSKTDAFLQILVSGSVITGARKTIILTP